MLLVAILIAGACCAVTGYLSHSEYIRAQAATAQLQQYVGGLDARLTGLEAHKARELTPIRVWGMISTTDRATNVCFLPWENDREPLLEARLLAKGGGEIRPEIRLPAGSTIICEYDIRFGKEFGVVADAWLTHADPYRDLAEFEQLDVFCQSASNIVRLIARPRSDGSIQMHFHLLVLCEK
jgi:hypothetical protein